MCQIHGYGLTQRMTQRLENGLDLMVGIAAIQHLYMQGNARIEGKRAQKLLRELRVIVANQRCHCPAIINKERTIADVQRYQCEGLIHRQIEGTIALDAFFVTERLPKGLAENDTDILNGMMAIYIDIAFAFHNEIEVPMRGEQRKHVVEKAHASIDITMPLAIEVKGQVNCCFRSLSVYMCCSHIRHAPLQNS